MSAIRRLLRAPIHFAAQSGEPVHGPLVLVTIGALRGTVVAIGPDSSTPVFWQVEGV